MSKALIEVRLIEVTFLVGVSPYQQGEGAGFRPEFAHRLVALGVAEYANPKDVGVMPSPYVSAPADEREASMLREVERLKCMREMTPKDREMAETPWGGHSGIESLRRDAMRKIERG